MRADKTLNVPPCSAPLRVFGNAVIELAPILLAAERMGSYAIRLGRGGIPNLLGAGDPLPADSRAAFAVGPGMADLATHSETQSLRYSQAHDGLRIIMTVAVGHYRVVARRSAGIARIGDLRGKRVGAFPLSSAAYHLHGVLRAAGMDEADIVPVPMHPAQRILDALLAGELDAMSVWEPEAESALEQLGRDAIELRDGGEYREHFNLHALTSSLADPQKNPRIVAFVRAVRQAAADIEADGAAAVRLLAGWLGAKPALLAKALPHHHFIAALPPGLLELLAEEEAWLAQQTGRAARSSAILAGLIDASVIEAASRDV